jgi:serine/threonine-protein kinase
MPLAPGACLGRFQIVRQLGAGAMGEVYLAHDPRIERRVAIKTVRLEGRDDADAAGLHSRLHREARAAGRLVHPHVVTLFEAGEDGGVFFLAFEYVEGSDLAARMRRPPPPTAAEVVRIAREAASALAAAHRVGIVHRDIKPSNLLLAADGSLKIADFGIAQLTGQGTHLTQTGSVIGTPQYLSPEQVRGEPLDGRSDLFSLGALLYELLAGRLPFEAEGLAALVYQVLYSDPVPLGSVRPDLPPRLAGVIMRLLAKPREERFPSAAALGEELASLERDLFQGERSTAAFPWSATVPIPSAAPHDGVPHASAAAPPEVRAESLLMATPRPRRARWIAVLALPVLLAAAGLGIAVLRWSREPAPEPAAGAADEVRDAPRALSGAAPPDIVARADRAEAGEGVPEEGPPGTAAASGGRVAVEPPPPAEPDAEPQAALVAGAIMFEIAPPDAANRAVVKVDGLVRGPAVGSVVMLTPGRRRIEIIARGFAPHLMVVESRPDPGLPARLAVTMRQQ